VAGRPETFDDLEVGQQIVKRRDATLSRGHFFLCTEIPIAAWSVDRLGRSLQDLLTTLNELHGAGYNLYLHKQALDTRTPSGRAMFGMLGVFAEFEREMIRERMNAGLRRAVQQGKILGRPRVDAEIEKRVLRLRAGWQRNPCHTSPGRHRR
jgi:DNA invertase Pin-like site-specific DNA recombinase